MTKNRLKLLCCDSGWLTSLSKAFFHNASPARRYGNDKKLRIKAQTLRLYNPTSHQWSIYLVDLDNGTLGLPPVVGAFTGNRGEFFDQEDFKGRAILGRYVWLDLSPSSARMAQSFSPDGGKTWQVNWTCELSR